MQKRFQTIKDYHVLDPSIRVEAADYPHLRVSVLHEASGDIRFSRTDRSGLVVTLDGTRSHLTQMDGIIDPCPSLAGQVCQIPHGLEVRLQWENHEPVQRSLMFEFDEGFFQTYVPEIVTGAFQRGHLRPAGFADRPAIAALVGLLSRETDPGRARGRLFADSAIRLLALELARQSWTVPGAGPGESPRVGAGQAWSSRRDIRVDRVLDYIEVHFARDLTVLELAEVAGLSPTHFTRAFRDRTGKSPYSYVIDRRLSEAVKLLRSSTRPIAVVALDSGFVDQAHLTRMLRARHGRTPRDVRTG